VNRSNLPTFRLLGTPRPPRRRFIPPAAVRIAQLCILFRVVFVVGMVLVAPSASIPTNLVLPGLGHLTLPGPATWVSLGGWIVAGGVFEGALALRLGWLRTGSRRVIVFMETLVIVAAGLYTAAGLKTALVPLVVAIAAVVMLRLDHVRHSFDRATAQRRVVWQTIPGVLYDGYTPPDPLAEKEIQRIGYRLGVDTARADVAATEMFRA
jgi:hypothetical protein